MMTWFYAKVTGDDFNVPKATLDDAAFSTILQIVFGIAGALALIVLLIASLKYVTSQGDPAATAKAKNSIIYAVIGLFIAAMAFSIVTFVVKSL